MSDLTPTAQTAIDAVTDDELTEAEDLCGLVGIPAEYARNVAAALTICEPGGGV
jgi:hypothetical protein